MLARTADEADMREVSHFLLELKNGSESRGDVVCGIPHSAPENEVGAGSGLDSPQSATPNGLDPLQSASSDTKVGIVGVVDKTAAVRILLLVEFYQCNLSAARRDLFGPSEVHFDAGTCGCFKHEARASKIMFWNTPNPAIIFSREVGNFCWMRPWKRSRLPRTRTQKAIDCLWQGAFTRPRYT